MAVVMEKRMILDLDEIKAVIIICRHCAGEISVIDFFVGQDTHSRALFAESCPQCGRSWKSETVGTQEDRGAAQKLFDALGHFTNERFRKRLSAKEVLMMDFKLQLSGNPD